MKVWRIIMMVGVCAAMLTACGGEDAETTPETTPPGAGAEPGAKTAEEMGSALGEMAEEAGEEMAQAMEAFKAEYSEQLDTHESKVEALKAAASAFSDDKLSGLLGDLDSTLADARTKLGDIANADEGSGEAMKGELTSLMEGISGLYEQAMARVEELKSEGLPELPGLPTGG